MALSLGVLPMLTARAEEIIDRGRQYASSPSLPIRRVCNFVEHQTLDAADLHTVTTVDEGAFDPVAWDQRMNHDNPTSCPSFASQKLHTHEKFHPGRAAHCILPSGPISNAHNQVAAKGCEPGNF